jgi:hypothetical protein
MLESGRTQVMIGVLLAGVAPAGVGAQNAFEGVVHMTMTAAKGQPPADMTQMVKGTKSRHEMKMGGQTSVMIMDMGAGTMTVLIPPQRMYMTMNLKQTGDALKGLTPPGAARSGAPGVPPAPPKITATGKTEVIAGHTCEHYAMGEPQQFDVCAAKGLGHFLMGGAPAGPMGGIGGGMAAAALPPGWSDAVKAFADGFFPMKMERVEGGKRETMLQVTKVEPKPLDDSLFAPPPDYKEMKLPTLPFGPRKQ